MRNIIFEKSCTKCGGETSSRPFSEKLKLKSCTKCGGETSTRPFSEKLKLSISLDQ